MAYEPSAATTSQTAEILSPRASAMTPQATAPSRETAVQRATDRGDMRDFSGARSAGSARGDVGMTAPHLEGGVRTRDRTCAAGASLPLAVGSCKSCPPAGNG